MPGPAAEQERVGALAIAWRPRHPAHPKFPTTRRLLGFAAERVWEPIPLAGVILEGTAYELRQSPSHLGMNFIEQVLEEGRAVPVTPMRVLLVEDTDELRETFALLLELLGCEVRAAPCGWDALDAAADFTPELVLTDFNMPMMDGVELIRRLKSVPGFDRVPMVMVTASDTDCIEQAARAAGAADVIAKPADVLSLVGRFERGEFAEA